MTLSQAKLGRCIRSMRSAHGWTQRELAYRIGVQAGHVTNWERGMCYPQVVSFQRIAKVFGLTMDELVEKAAGR